MSTAAKRIRPQPRPLTGDEGAKRSAAMILEVLAGKRSVIEAGALLGLGEAMLHRLKTRAIQAGVESLEPKPTGRPRAEPARDAELEALQSEVRRLEREFKAAQVREEIARVQILPNHHVVHS